MGGWLEKGRKARHRGACMLPIRRKQSLDVTDVRRKMKKMRKYVKKQGQVPRQHNNLQKVRRQHWRRALAAQLCLVSSVSRCNPND